MKELIKKLDMNRFDLLESVFGAFTVATLIPYMLDWMFAFYFLPATLGFGYAAYIFNKKSKGEETSEKTTKVIFIGVCVYYVLLIILMTSAFIVWKHLHG